MSRAGLCEGRVVIITGAGRGIGRAHALAFGRAGAKVVVNDLGVSADGQSPSNDAAHAVVAEITAAGGEAIANFDDVSNWEAAGRLVGDALQAFGRLDVVVNNAGIVRDRMFVSATESEWDDVMRVHLKGHFCVSRHAAGHWRQLAKGGETPDARIINTTSGAGLQGSIAQAAYGAAKGGIASLTLVQAAEMGRYGITANAIAPAARTRMTETAFPDMMAKPASGFDAMDPANISPLVVWLGSPESSHVTGQVFEVAGGEISIAEGWHRGPAVRQNAPWHVDMVGDAVDRLMAERRPAQKVYGTSS